MLEPEPNAGGGQTGSLEAPDAAAALAAQLSGADLAEGAEPEAPGPATLVEHRLAVEAELSVGEVYEWFRQSGAEFAAVVQDGRLIGIVSKGRLGFLLGSRFGFSIFARHPVRTAMLEAHLAFSHRLPLRPLLQTALSRHGESFYDDVAVVDDEGGYLGMISVQRLVRVQTALIVEHARTIERHHRELERKNQELFRSLNQLRQSEGRFGILFDNAALGVALVNARGEIEHSNRRFDRLLAGAVTANSARRMPLAEMVTDTGREAFLDFLRRVESKDARDMGHMEIGIALPERGQRLFRVFGSWIDETGQICLLLDDITEQRVLERRMVQQEKSALLESLVGGIAHEINNKLSPIIGFADLLQEELEGRTQGEPCSRYCATIRSSALESAQIVRQMLQLSRPVLRKPFTMQDILAHCGHVLHAAGA